MWETGDRNLEGVEMQTCPRKHQSVSEDTQGLGPGGVLGGGHPAGRNVSSVPSHLSLSKRGPSEKSPGGVTPRKPWDPIWSAESLARRVWGPGSGLTAALSPLIGSRSLLSGSSLSPVRLFATPWTVARQAPLSMEFSTYTVQQEEPLSN